MHVMNEDKKAVDMAQGVKNLTENIVALMEFERLNARLTRAKFLALIEQGFNEAQALELCKRAT
jgi:hypothetical protein